MIKQYYKQLLVALGITAVIGGSIMLGGEADDLQHIVDTVATTESEYFDINGKYLQIASSTYNDLNYYAYEYVAPNNTRGYQLFVQKATTTATTTAKLIRSYGYGPEAVNRTWDWQLK